MNLGNNFVGLTTNEGYHCVRIFPFGLEFCVFKDFLALALIIGPIEINLQLKKNITLFR